ncbi:hypothetical protein LOTGIDRAFT_124768 [Lottia gigantea]|uniref:SKA complex subunit 1 n=1 Tax=Lottia gigantea TaxID=225164 RepID=V3ZEL5_LOTGI|nr:hypothetical protein LOTGIDRAFT_124768 [Lottia gigantea]ESO89588.1 hypothetical protein LOTGIDRAFT_124768 [Lottia gigantea]
MESTSLLELAGHFNDKLSTLKTVCELRKSGQDGECNQHLVTIATELESLELTMSMLKQEVKKQKQELKSVQDMRGNFEKLIKDLIYTSNNIPARLPGTNRSTKNTVSNNNEVTIKDEVVKKPASKKQHCPLIEYLTVEEFEDVPKYMKGRVMYNQVNTLLDELNKTFTAKYKIVHQKRSTMNDLARKRNENYKSQQTKDTEGVYFVVEADIKDFSTIKLDAVTRAILTILRHCGRIREIRGGKLTRYAIIESY